MAFSDFKSIAEVQEAYHNVMCNFSKCPCETGVLPHPCPSQEGKDRYRRGRIPPPGRGRGGSSFIKLHITLSYCVSRSGLS